MQIRNDILFNVSASVTSERLVFLHLMLTNTSPNNYYVSKGVLLLDGLHEQTFSIHGPSAIACDFHSMPEPGENYIHQLLFLGKDQVLSNSLLISNVCSFQYAKPGIYHIRFNSGFFLHAHNQPLGYQEKLNEIEEYSHLIGQTSFIIGNNPEDIALQSLTYESGL